MQKVTLLISKPLFIDQAKQINNLFTSKPKIVLHLNLGNDGNTISDPKVMKFFLGEHVHKPP